MARRLIWPKIYIYGDSLTQFSFSKDGGWASILANEFQRKADIISRGFSGYNTRQCKALLPYLETDFQNISIAGVFLGANDANDPLVNPQQGVPLDEYKENLKDIVKFIKNATVTNERHFTGRIPSMFLITPPALDEERWRAVCLAEGKICCDDGFSRVKKYANACRETARELGIHCVDLHTQMLKQNNWKEYLNDGLHFSPKGSEFVASQLLPPLENFLKEGSLVTEGGIMPEWREVNSTNPDVSFKHWLYGDGKTPGHFRDGLND